MVGIDLNAIRHALAVARKRGYDEVELKFGGVGFQARLSSAGIPVAKPSTDPLGADEESHSGSIDLVAPVVGYYRAKGKPLDVGRKVQKGEILAVVSGLGLDTDVEAPADGEVVEVRVKPDQPVEYAQILARVEVTA
jgi:biotin carboxyl carrier protein